MFHKCLKRHVVLTFWCSIMQKDFGIEWIRHDSAMQDAFKAAYECFKSESKFVTVSPRL